MKGLILGAIAGFAIVHSLFLNLFEKAAWEIFWAGLEHGKFLFNTEILKHSSTFWKLSMGGVVV